MLFELEPTCPVFPMRVQLPTRDPEVSFLLKMAYGGNHQHQVTSRLYELVIADVIKECKPDFDAAGYSEDLLGVLQEVTNPACSSPPWSS